jgi:hypothetical protein
VATGQALSNRQEAPYPADLVEHCTYRPHWSVALRELDRGQGCTGLTVVITVMGPDSYPPHDPMSVAHLFPVPAAAYNRASWCRWLFDCLLLVERHEAMEFFEVAGEVRPTTGQAGIHTFSPS